MILINPQTKKLGKFSRYVPMYVPVGIGWLAGNLREHGKTVRIIDENITPVTEELMAEKLKGIEKPYIFGITCLSAGIARAYELSKFFKEKYPGSKVLIGGIHPTVLPDEGLQTGTIDIVARREAEETIINLYDTIKKNGDYSNIPGISFVDNGKIRHNPDAPLPDLEKLPLFAYDVFENHIDRYSFGFITSARGCPFNCVFCSQRAISGRVYRYIPVDKVINTLDIIVNKYDQKYVTFIDDDFIVNRERTKKLCTMMKESGIAQKAVFDCQTRGDSMNEEMLDYLKMAGVRTIDFGIETASERLMKLINKGETVQDNVDAVKMAKKAGFQVSATFILGLPTETRQERWMAYKLAKELDLDYVRFNNATPYPGTKLFQIAKEENRLNIGPNWSNLNACGTLVQSPNEESHLAYVPAGTTEGELMRDVLKANLYFSLRPKRVIKLIVERVGPAGWFSLPKGWYLNPKEIYYFTRFVFNVFTSFIGVLIKR